MFGIFDEDFSILASTSANEIVEFNAFDGGVHPSRFELPTGFTVQRVFRPSPDKTFVYGWKKDARVNTLKRDPHEAAWELDLTVVNEGATEFDVAVSIKEAVQLQLEHLDGGSNVNVWIQRFPY